MAERIHAFMKDLGEASLQVSQYRATLMMLGDLFPSDPEVTSIKGHAIMTGMTEVDKSKIIKDVDTTIIITRTEPGSSLKIGVGIEVEAGNFVSVSEIILPSLKSARPKDMEEAANDEVLQIVIGQIQLFGAARNSFRPYPQKS